MTLMPITRRDGTTVMDTGPQIPQGGFLWGRGGTRISPEDLAARMALSNTQPDFSPVAGPLGALGRVAQNLYGAVQLRNIDRDQSQQQAVSAADRTAQIAQLLGPNNADLIPALSSSDKIVSALAGNVLESRQPKAAAPTELQRNYDWLLGMGREADANNLIGRSTQNVQWVTTDNGDGTKSIVPISGNAFQGGGGQMSPPTAPVGKLTPIDPSQMGGPASAPGGFR